MSQSGRNPEDGWKSYYRMMSAPCYTGVTDVPSVHLVTAERGLETDGCYPVLQNIII